MYDYNYSATKIAKMFAVTAKEINNKLINLGLAKKDSKGYLAISTMGKTIVGREGTYIRWNEEILAYKPLLDMLEKEVTCKPSMTKKNYREAFPSSKRCDSGHNLKSFREIVVANWLYHNYFSFASEKRLPLGSNEDVYSDFYLNKEKIYIEVWGMTDEKYLKRRKIKEAIYKKYGYKLISLETEDVENLDDILPVKLAEFGVRFF